MNTEYPDKMSFDVAEKNYRRMHTDLVVGLLAIVIIAACLSLGGYLLVAYQKGAQRLEEEADQHLAYLVKSLEMPIWSMDDNTVRHIGEAYMASEEVSLLEIVANYGQTVFAKQREDEKELVLREGQLIHRGQVIGNIHLGLSRIGYQKELRRLLLSSIGILIVVVLAMTAATFVMLRYFVRQPLQMLMDVAKDMSRGDYEHHQRQIRHYEISMVYDQLVAMAGSIKRREASLEEVNSRLRGEIARRTESELELRRLRNYLFNIINSMPSVLVAVDEKSRVTLWNSKTEQITGIGFEKADKQPLSAVFPRLAEKMGEIETAIRDRRVISDPKMTLKIGEDIRFEDITIFPLIANGVEGAVIRLDDVTEQVRMEEMLIQSEKMLTVGGLAAGMAHEINNPLAGILQTAEVMSNRLGNRFNTPANEKAAEEAGVSLEGIQQYMQIRGIFRMIDTINVSGRRVADIVSNMLSFARKSDEGIKPHPLDRILDNSLDLASTDYDLKKDYDFKKIKIIKEYAEDLPAVMCDNSKIQQVLLNIIGNGAQAMKTAGVTEPQMIVRTFLDKGRDMVCLEIEDNGPGMDEETRKKVFDPFFTTKPPGMGTGLGLSVSYFIITENHGGEMTVKSDPGAGATFIISLPLKGK